MLDHPISYDEFYRNRYLGADFKFVWLPQRCNLTNKRIWLQFAYRLTAIWSGPGEPVYETKWHDKNAHIIWMLKR